jgi:predicted esterase
MTGDFRRCTFSARLDCHYLLRDPARSLVLPARGQALIVALHGFGQNPETMLELTVRLFGEHHVFASVQGPNQFFLDARASQVGYGWITNQHATESIRLHHDMMLHVLNEAGREHGIAPERRILVGFSQPVSLNYRFAATFPDAVRGVVGICGGLPGDWDSGSYCPVRASVLHLARKQDEFYPPAATEQYAGRLRLRVKDVEFHLLDGGHAMPSKAGAVVETWLNRILR